MHTVQLTFHDNMITQRCQPQVGSGREHFDRARHMLKAWQHMDLGEATST